MQSYNERKCPKCNKQGFWQTKDKRLKCKNCLYIFTLKPNPLNVPDKILKEIVSEFLLEHSTNIILERVNVSKYKLLKILAFLRRLMAADIPRPLCKIIKLRQKDFEPESKIKNPVIGILCKEEKVYAKILPEIEPKEIKDFLKNRNTDNFENWQKYFGIAFRNRFYRLAPLEDKKYRIDSLENFWGYLKKKLSAKGGIRKERLPLYLGEYAWRYNHRKLSLQEQEENLLRLLIANN